MPGITKLSHFGARITAIVYGAMTEITAIVFGDKL